MCDLAAQLGQIRRKTDAAKAPRDARAELGNRSAWFFGSIPKNMPDLILHATAMTLCSALKANLNLLFKVTNYELRHGCILPYRSIDIMISQEHGSTSN
jgi:hypothetical protein